MQPKSKFSKQSSASPEYPFIRAVMTAVQRPYSLSWGRCPNPGESSRLFVQIEGKILSSHGWLH